MTGGSLTNSGAWWLELLIALFLASAIGGGVALAGHDDRPPRPVVANASATPSSGSETEGSATRGLAEPRPTPEGEKQNEAKQPPKLNGSGTLRIIEGTSEVFGSGPLYGFAVEVEKGLPIDAQDFADDAVAVLADERSWIGVDGISVQRVPAESASFKITLAGPALTDELCAPLITNGIYSCFNSGRAVINFSRWMEGASAYGDDLASYRRYVINHEAGHAFGHGHVACPAAGLPAPIMMQQTKGVAPCRPNPWPATS